MSFYKVKRQKKANKPGKFWVVITPDNRIANGHYHSTEQEADRHCEALNAYFGGKDEYRTS